ncbi:hypothetical protein DID75_01925 [Candidatus Marinamargulisbacteria bacterium SCGC AG-410-N11]|nr:hypothetical protein DID75_01925 [Candidatus Marinamargulisbacteria bacterium SCGC AG-410-N11]
MLLVPESVKSAINLIISKNTLSSTYLFHGGLGSFSTKAAMYFGFCLFCNQQNFQGNCQACSNCKKIESEHFPDMITLPNSGTLKIDNIRTLQDRIKYGPSNSSKLLVIIPNCERFTTESSNAILKTLEEPPKNVIFILTTHSWKSVPLTIQSRSQTFFIPKTPIKNIKSYIEDKYNFNFNSYPLTYSLLNYLIQHKGVCPDSYKSFFSFSKLSSHERILYASSISKDKLFLKPLLYSWLEEIQNETPPNLSVSNHIISTIKSLNYNVNSQLQLENLFINHL